MHGFMQLVDRLSVKAIFNRFDKRKLQNELDTHRLYLLTSHFDRLAAGAQEVKPDSLPAYKSLFPHTASRVGRELGQHYVEELAAEAQRLGHEVLPQTRVCTGSWLSPFVVC